ncbi:hypothetical protein F5Y01DRAFT_290751 [Xylaria sp. FL0043]|nr:hypothetical protein F5Y01DRAFT_290751 [Xylaria sp. FL0043]
MSSWGLLWGWKRTVMAILCSRSFSNNTSGDCFGSVWSNYITCHVDQYSGAAVNLPENKTRKTRPVSPSRVPSPWYGSQRLEVFDFEEWWLAGCVVNLQLFYSERHRPAVHSLLRGRYSSHISEWPRRVHVQALEVLSQPPHSTRDSLGPSKTLRHTSAFACECVRIWTGLPGDSAEKSPEYATCPM